MSNQRITTSGPRGGYLVARPCDPSVPTQYDDGEPDGDEPDNGFDDKPPRNAHVGPERALNGPAPNGAAPAPAKGTPKPA